MHFRILPLLAAASAASAASSASAANPASTASAASSSRAEAALRTLQGWYNFDTGLWDTCGWWNGANCMTAIADLAKIDPRVLGTAFEVFYNTYFNAPAYNPNPQVSKTTNSQGLPESHYGTVNPPNNNMKQSANISSHAGNAIGFVDTCYDDDGWWALAWMYAYDLTGNPSFLHTAQGIYAIMETGGPTNCGGGIYWCSNSNYVNSIANELFLSVAAHLANRVPNNGSAYAAAAAKQWNWFKSQPFINSHGTINDGLTTSCQNNGQTVWSYNQGVVLGGLVELYKANGDRSLITAANSIAHAAIANLTNSNDVLVESCEPNCGPDGSQFKGIFMRNLAILNRVSPDPAYSQVIQSSANSLWANDRLASNGSLSLDWAGPYINPANASTHSSALEALIAQAALS